MVHKLTDWSVAQVLWTVWDGVTTCPILPKTDPNRYVVLFWKYFDPTWPLFESLPGQHSKIEKIKLCPVLPKWPFPFFRKSAKLPLLIRLEMLPLERMESEFDHIDSHQPTWYSRFYLSWFFVVHQRLVEGIFCIAKHKAFEVFNKSFDQKRLWKWTNQKSSLKTSLSSEIVTISHIPVVKWWNNPRWGEWGNTIDTCKHVCITHIRPLFWKPVYQLFLLVQIQISDFESKFQSVQSLGLCGRRTVLAENWGDRGNHAW